MILGLTLVITGCSGGGTTGGASVSTPPTNTPPVLPAIATWLRVFPKSFVYKTVVNPKTMLTDIAYNIDYYFRNELIMKAAHAAARKLYKVSAKGDKGLVMGMYGEILTSNNKFKDWAPEVSGEIETFYDGVITTNASLVLGGNLEPIMRRSENGGPWLKPTFNGPSITYFTAVSVDPTNPNKMVVGGASGKAYSSDNGKTFTCYGGVNHQAILYWGEGCIFAIDANNHEVLAYRDDDMSVVKYTISLPGISTGITRVNDDLIVSGFQAPNTGKVWRIRFTNVQTGNYELPVDITPTEQGIGYWALSSAGANDISVACSADKIYHSTDSGSTWVLETTQTTGLTSITGLVTTSDGTNLGVEQDSILKK